ncbi:MAG: fucose isomerase [Spirochaetales bacterium]|nr:fucose isomerase [Spirochaetales bacterium]
MQFAYVPIGVPTFDLEVAQDQFDKSCALMRGCFGKEAVCPEKMLLSLPDLKAYLTTINPDLIVLQNITFANSAYCSEVVSAFPAVPVLLWTLREPVIDGKRLRLNSLTGAYSAGNVMKNLGKGNFGYVFGSPDDEDVKKVLTADAAALRTLAELRSCKVAAIGTTPEGFGFGRALDADVQRVFGSRLLSVELREILDKAKSYSFDECRSYLDSFCSTCCDYDHIPEKNMEGYARLMKAYADFCTENNVKVIGSRCWPDLFTQFGTPNCAVLSMLNDMGIASACESDMYGGISMFLASRLSGGAVFFGDPVSMNEKENTVTYWHCGMCAPSLASKPSIGVHPNRKIGPAMDFGCRPCGNVTVFRVGRDADGAFRAFVATGSALDKPKQFFGASVVVKVDGNARDLVYESVKDGWEPHFVVAYADIAFELEELCRMLGIPVCRY